jgi:hypothetical protein
MVIMFIAHCPYCNHNRIGIILPPDDDAGKYYCEDCDMILDVSELKLEPIKEANDANPFRS